MSSNFTQNSIFPGEPNTISTDMIQDVAVTAPKVAVNAINTAAIVDGSVTDVKLATPKYTTMERQAIINGNFNIWQRGTSFVNPSGGYTTDRFAVDIGAGGTLPTTLTHDRLSITSGELAGSFYAYRLTTDGAGSGFTGGAHYFLQQFIENGNRFLCGSGKSITVSFYARSSIAGKRLGVSPAQFYGSGGSPSSAEVDLPGTNFTLTTSWVRYTHTFLTNTLAGKTFGTNNDDSLAMRFGYMWASSWNANFGSGTIETFGGSGTIDIAQVQVNAGTTALPFSPQTNADELDLCNRYFRVGGFGAFGRWDSATSAQVFGQFDVPMRKAPTITLNTTTPQYSEVGNTNRTGTGSTITGQSTQPTGYQVFVGGFTGATVGAMAAVNSNPFNFDAEL